MNWIRPEEGLPEQGQTILVYGQTIDDVEYKFYLAFMTDMEDVMMSPIWTVETDPGCKEIYIIKAWMPLPQPPKDPE